MISVKKEGSLVIAKCGKCGDEEFFRYHRGGRFERLKKVEGEIKVEDKVENRVEDRVEDKGKGEIEFFWE